MPKRSKTKQVTVPLVDLVQDPNNARLHSDANRRMIERSIAEVGPARPIVVDENYVILAGNATQAAAVSNGVPETLVVETDGETIVAVRVRGLDEKQKATLAMFDNRAADLASWDPARLAAIDAAMPAVLPELFFPNELDAILNRSVDGTPVARPQSDGADITLGSRHGVSAAMIRWRGYKLYLPADTASRLREAFTKLGESGRMAQAIAGPLAERLKADVATA